MSVGKEEIRQRLSHLKNRLISLDLQNIYQFAENSRREVSGSDEPSAINFKVYDNREVLELIAQIHPMNEAEQRFARDRLQAGDRALIGFCQENPVFYGWLMFDEIELTYGVFHALPHGSVFAYNLFTAPAFRRRGAMSAFYHHVFDNFMQREQERLYCGISTDNRASISAHEKNGFAKTGSFHTVKLLGWCFTLSHFAHAGIFHLNRP